MTLITYAGPFGALIMALVLAGCGEPVLSGNVLPPAVLSATVGEDSPCSSGGRNMLELPATIFGKTWFHSHEEDTADVRVYRPDDYDFPPARGRDGFEFREGGAFIYYGIARGDGTEEAMGTWTVESPGRIRIELQHERIQPFVLEIVSCDDETLKVRR
jgi:hypothetical protein